jgi:hypothetical protein
LAYGVETANSEDVKQKRSAALERLQKRPLLFIDENRGSIFGRLAAALTNSGRGHSFRIQDLWIASQAVRNGFPDLTETSRTLRIFPVSAWCPSGCVRRRKAFLLTGASLRVISGTPPPKLNTSVLVPKGSAPNGTTATDNSRQQSDNKKPFLILRLLYTPKIR